MNAKPISRDRIRIEGLRIDCIIGVYPEEALREQPIMIDLALALDLSRAGRSGNIADTCDYDRISREVAALVVFRKFRLLENAAEEIAAMLFGLHEQLDSMQIRIEKPEALSGRARCAAVEISRSRSDFPRTTEQTIFGEAEILLETREAGLYLLHIDAGKEIPPPLSPDDAGTGMAGAGRGAIAAGTGQRVPPHRLAEGRGAYLSQRGQPASHPLLL